jgi:hypothetical protein
MIQLKNPQELQMKIINIINKHYGYISQGISLEILAEVERAEVKE